MLKIIYRKKRWLLSLFFILCLGFLVINHQNQPTKTEAQNYPNFQDNPYLDERMRSLMAPYLLPLNHPAKPILDSLFSNSRVIENKESLLKAGFSIIAAMQLSYVIVAKHPDIPGYVFKLYLDSETNTKEAIPHWEWLTRRCIGAASIRKVIKEKKLSLFIVPDKWLYVLPPSPATKETHQQPVIVIETDMKLRSEKATKKAWVSEITPKHLDELYSILKQGYGTVVVTSNIPYTKKKKFAFTDTEYPNRTHDLHKVKEYLSADMQSYWDSLIIKNETHN